MKSFFGTDRLKRSRILKAILFIIIMIGAVSSMSLLYKSVYAQEENQQKYTTKKRVLFISSYSYAWETVPEQIAGIKEVLNEDVVIDYKFMDSKNLTSSESVDDFYRHMVYYLGEVEPYDAIIVGDDAAFNFAVDNKDTLFKDIPIFFEGVNNDDKAVAVSASSQITGVIESLSYKNTIKAASKIIPDAKKIVAILDDTVTGMGERIQYYKYKNPRTFLSSGGLGTMGYGLGAAIGAQVANPGKQVINIAGDGCFRMNMNEIATAVRQKLPLIEVIVNNHVLGMVRQWQDLFYEKRYSATVLDDGVDYVKLAEAMGATGYRATTRETFNEALKAALAAKTPVVIDCVIGCDDKVWPMVAPGADISTAFTGEDLAAAQS